MRGDKPETQFIHVGDTEEERPRAKLDVLVGEEVVRRIVVRKGSIFADRPKPIFRVDDENH